MLLIQRTGVMLESKIVIVISVRKTSITTETNISVSRFLMQLCIYRRYRKVKRNKCFATLDAVRFLLQNCICLERQKVLATMNCDYYSYLDVTRVQQGASLPEPP